MRLIIRVGIALVLIGGPVAYFVNLDPQTVSYRTVSYRTAPVERGDLEITVNASGTIKPVKTVDVSSQLSGQISELLVDFNDEVREGQPIARLDSRSFAARVRGAKSAVEVAQIGVKTKQAAIKVAEADLENAQSSRFVLDAQVESVEATNTQAKQDLERKTSLFARQTISEAQIEQARATDLSAAAAVRAKQAERAVNDTLVLRAEANLQLAKEDLKDAIATVDGKKALLNEALIELERTTIQSPINGVVVGRNVDLGQTVAASLEAPKLFVIAQDLRQMEVHAKVDEADIGRIQRGQSVRFTVESYPGRAFSGTVVQIRKSPEVVQNVVTYTVVISAENLDLTLLPGMTAFATIIVQSSSGILRLPNAALRFTPPLDGTGLSKDETGVEGEGGGGASSVVWTLQDTPKPVPVRIHVGDSDGTSTEVISGNLTSGQRVIVGTIVPPKQWSFLGLRSGF
jgi:HlyD family secretion protein